MATTKTGPEKEEAATAVQDQPAEEEKKQRQTRKTKAATSKTKETAAKRKGRAKTVNTATETKKREKAVKEAEPEAVEAEIVDDGKGPKKGGVGKNGNLIPLNQRSKEVQREIQEKGRKKNKENWEARKDIRKLLCDFLDQKATPSISGNMEKIGVSSDAMSNMMAMFMSVFSKAVVRGDINALRTVMEYAGRAPLQEMRENEAIAKMSQAVMLAQQATGQEEKAEEDDMDVVFYIPDNGRSVITDEEKAAFATKD